MFHVLAVFALVPAMAPAQASAPSARNPAAGLVLHLKLDGSALDASEQRNRCRAVDIAPAADRFGRAKGAVRFNGKSSRIVIDPAPAGVGQAITVALWVRQDQAADPFVWIDVMDGDGRFTQPVIGQDDGYHVRCWQLWGGESFVWHRMAEFSSCWTKKPLELGRWYHVAATFDGSTHRLYLDGQLVQEAKGWFKFSRSEPIRIGAKGDETTPKHAFFTGDLDDIRIYSRALTTEEIGALAGAGGGPAVAGALLHEGGTMQPIESRSSARPYQAPEAMELEAPKTKVRTWIEGFAAPGGLRPMMQVLGDASGFGREGGWYTTEIFPLLMGVCGDAFRFAWYRRDGKPWQRTDSLAVASPASQYLPALQAAGYKGRVILGKRLAGRTNPKWTEAFVRREVVASIAQRGRPVLVLDLPEPGWTSLITGYKKGGETLVGWCEPGWESFGFTFDQGKKRAFDNWFAGAGGVVLLAERCTRPSEPDVLRSALERAVPELRRRSAAHVITGPATYEELAARLGDETLSADDAQTAKRRDAILFPMIWDLATQRHYASEFVRHAVDVLPAGAGSLTAAADQFKGIHDAVWEINRIGGGTEPGTPLPKLIDPVLRRQVAQIILRCRDRDLDAASRIADALTVTTALKAPLRAWPQAFSLPPPSPSRFGGARFPEDMPQAGVLGAAMDLLGDDLGLRWEWPDRFGLRVDQTHTFFMGITGEAFSFFWFPRTVEFPALDVTLYWPDPALPYRRALAAAGYTCEVVVRPGLTTKRRGLLDAAALKARIAECLVDRRLPAIAVGVPERNDFLLVTGYEDGGDTLTGWVSHGGDADVRFEPAKLVRARDWAAYTDLVVILTGRRRRVPEKDAIRDALARAERRMRPREFGPFHAGPASFDVWARAMVSDDPPAVGPIPARPSVEDRRRWLIEPATWDLMERVSYAGFFIDRAIALFPAAREELTAARATLKAVDDGMVRACSVTGGDPGKRLTDAEMDAKLADPAVRREVAGILLECKGKWLEAADHLKEALARMR